VVPFGLYTKTRSFRVRALGEYVLEPARMGEPVERQTQRVLSLDCAVLGIGVVEQSAQLASGRVVAQLGAQPKCLFERLARGLSIASASWAIASPPWSSRRSTPLWGFTMPEFRGVASMLEQTQQARAPTENSV
jgi:hypothetical protein